MWDKDSILKVQDLQQQIIDNSEVEQGYAYIVLRSSDWEWGNVICRLEMSGSPEWDATWHGYDDLVHLLTMFNAIAKSRGYRYE